MFKIKTFRKNRGSSNKSLKKEAPTWKPARRCYLIKSHLPIWFAKRQHEKKQFHQKHKQTTTISKTKTETTLWGSDDPFFFPCAIYVFFRLDIWWPQPPEVNGSMAWNRPSERVASWVRGVPNSWRQEAPWVFGSWPIPDAPWDWYIYLHETHKNQPNAGYRNDYSIHGSMWVSFGCLENLW